MEGKIIRTGTSQIWKGGDGVIRVEVDKDVHIDLNEAEIITSSVLSFAENSSSCLLVDISQIKSIEQQAREYFAKGSEIAAFVLIVKSPLSRLIGNFFIGLNKSAVTCRIFSSRELGLQWLKDLAKQQK